MMTFSKDKDVLKALFKSGFDNSLFVCYIEGEKVLGIMGLATNKVRPLKFEHDICVSLFGKMKGKILCKQMNTIFQKAVVKGDRELYIDILATAARLYEKLGFYVYKKEIFSPMCFLGSGYPILMRKEWK